MSDKQPKRTISRSTYLQALGLFTLANKRAIESKVAEAELARLLGYGDDPYAGCVSDEIFEDRPKFDQALARENIVVRQK